MDSQNSNYDSDQRSNDMKKYLLIGFLAFALVGSLGYNWYLINKNTEEISSLKNSTESKLNSIETQKLNLAQELESLKVEYDSIQTLVVEKNDNLNEKENYIQQKQEEIERLINESGGNQEDIDRLNSLIADLKKETESYKTEIAKLKNENKTLRDENTDVTSKNERLSTNLDSVQTSSQEKDIRISEKDEKINIGSTLNASNFTIKGIKLKSSGKEVETSKAKRVDKIRVSFDLDENRISESGSKELFISVKTPDGEISTFKNGSNGILTLKTGEKVGYSDKIVVPYKQGTKVPVTFDWEGTNFEQGEYHFTVYQNNFKIGEGKTSLKSSWF